MLIGRNILVFVAGAFALFACDTQATKEESPQGGEPVAITNATATVPVVDPPDPVSAADGEAEDLAVTQRECNSGEVYVLADGLCAFACTQDTDCTVVGGVCAGRGLVGTGPRSASRARYCVAEARK
jgi:hypothetical protein